MSGELVYLVYPDSDIVDRLSRALHSSGYKVLSMRSEDEAEAVISNFKYVLPDVLVTPLDDPGSRDGILIKLLTANPLMEQVPVVILGSGDQEQRRRALRQGLTHLIFPPYDVEEVILTTSLALDRHRDEQSLFGSVSQLSVSDLLQTIEVGRRTGSITLRRSGTKGRIWFREGAIIEGEISDGRSGEEAVEAMVIWTEGTFEAEFGAVSVPGRINVSPSAILLDAMRRLDEERRDIAEAARAAETRASSGEHLPVAAAVGPPEEAAEDGEELDPVEREREAATIHLALALLNIAAAYGLQFFTPRLLRRRLELIHERLERRHPALRIFDVTAGGMIAIAYDVTVVLSSEDVVAATSAWLSEFLATMEQSMPGRWTLERFSRLTQSYHGDMRESGFFAALGLDPREETGR